MSIISEALRRAEEEKRSQKSSSSKASKKNNGFTRTLLSLGCIVLITGCIFYTRYNLNADRSILMAKIPNPSESQHGDVKEFSSPSSGLAQLAIESKILTAPPVAITPASVGAEMPVINGIISWGDEVQLLINGELYGEGDVWKNQTITEITEKGAYFKNKDNEPRFIEA
ncbi:MAG: hypothetical protein KC649_02040 [Candidatus Omnitrophica bacterium]|nr:hypothetical protein [Candidatus Omnitrophota bacterium]